MVSDFTCPSEIRCFYPNLSQKQTQMGTTVAGVLAGETPYMPHLHKRSEIGVIISYALITLKPCIANGTANLLFWYAHLIPYSM